MITVTFEDDSLVETYENGTLAQVEATFLFDHPTQGSKRLHVLLPSSRLSAWQAANDTAKTALLRSEVQAAAGRFIQDLDAEPVVTQQRLSDGIFGDPIEL